MSEFEFGLIVAGNAFHRWVVHCMSAAGLKDLTPLDVLVLHHVTHRARDKRLADICFIMNIEDTHLVNYALKKLQSLGVVASSKHGKEVTYAATEAGRQHVERYRVIREDCLIAALKADPTVPALIRTDEGLKVQGNNGNMYIAVFRKRLDPLAPREPPPPNDNAAAALAASDAGYTPKEGGERRGMTW
jgi:predicted transcriptional regulator